MLLEILLGTGVGICLGIITGLTPGIHINLVSLLLLSASPFLLSFLGLHTIIVMIIGMAVTHTFLDTIPSIFLGAPDADVALAVLPGHQYLHEGRGYEAIVLTVIGSLASLIIIIALAPVLGQIVVKVYPLIKNYIGYILIVVSLFLILRERTSRTWALVIFLLAGVLGIACFNIQSLRNPLFPLLSGLFGISMLVISLKK